jgi:hypothetical protein
MSADEPAGNSTVISIVGLCANGFFCAGAEPVAPIKAASPTRSPATRFIAIPWFNRF